MKKILFLIPACLAVATPVPPGPRPVPHKIDVSIHPAVELATKEAGNVLVETSRTGLSIEMHSPDKNVMRAVGFNWRQSREVESTLQDDRRVVRFYDSDGDGLPDVRRTYERRGDNLILISSERLRWVATPDEYDPRNAKK